MTGAEDIDYFGHRLHVMPFASGWRVLIYKPGSVVAETTIPQTMRPDQRNACIREAMQFVLGSLEK